MIQRVSAGCCEAELLDDGHLHAQACQASSLPPPHPAHACMHAYDGACRAAAAVATIRDARSAKPHAAGPGASPRGPLVPPASQSASVSKPASSPRQTAPPSPRACQTTTCGLSQVCGTHSVFVCVCVVVVVGGTRHCKQLLAGAKHVPCQNMRLCVCVYVHMSERADGSLGVVLVHARAPDLPVRLLCCCCCCSRCGSGRMCSLHAAKHAHMAAVKQFYQSE